MQTYLLRANPWVVVANRSCNLESGDRSSPPDDSRWGAPGGGREGLGRGRGGLLKGLGKEL